ncbi:MAG: tRNA lysidine(34) synthetase TilS [Prevotella sp.]|jgi:tRNA(Ile)-lysidine synthase
MIFSHNIANYISRHDLLHHDGFYLVALSGGADSVALLCVLKELGYHVEAIHCNFHLRGEESNRDEKFCESLCNQMAIPLHRVHFDTRLYAEAHKISIEMAARDLRYRYFEQLRHDMNADGICVAHHRDDQVETVMLNLVRGTGLAGLQGMKPKNGYILRPMLSVSKEQILAYLSDIQQEYVTDSTNLEDDVMRNKLRLNILPLLEEINPSVKDNILRMTENLSEAGKVVDDAMRKDIERLRQSDGSYDLSALCDSISPSYTLWTLLSPYGFNRTQVMEILANERSGAHWESIDYVSIVDRDHLYIISKDDWEIEFPVFRIPETGIFNYSFGEKRGTDRDGASHEIKFRLTIETIDNGFQINRSESVANLDADKVKFPLTIRPVREGDRFIPLGMHGSKLVSDFLTDIKVNLLSRRRQLVMTDAKGIIVWLVGKRIDNRFAINLKSSSRVLFISFT